MAGAGQVSLSVDPLAFGANLDVGIQLPDGTGAVLAEDMVNIRLAASISTNLPEGWRYYLTATGTGYDDPNSDGYTDYGSLGHYRVTGSMVPFSGDANHTPLVLPETVSIEMNQPVTIDVLANDTDADGDTLFVSDFTQGISGTVSMTGSGELIYAPQASFPGSDSFSYTVSDGNGGQDTATVSLTVSDTNRVVVSSDNSLRIPDNTTVASTISVEGVVGQLNDLDVSLNIRHLHDADLTITLVSPDGSRIDLADRVGGHRNHFANTVFDDEGDRPITHCAAPFTGNFQPQGGMLSIFDGINPSGTWTLELTDHRNIFVGTLNNWFLELTTM